MRQNILSLEECDYTAKLLLKEINAKQPTYLVSPKEEKIDLDLYHSRAKLTLTALAKNMVMPEVSLKSFFEMHRDPTSHSVLKLVLKCKNLYDARIEATKILKAVVELDLQTRRGSLTARLLQTKEPLTLTKSGREVVSTLIQQVSKCLTTVTCF
jgi:hypothetical protein